MVYSCAYFRSPDDDAWKTHRSPSWTSSAASWTFGPGSGFWTSAAAGARWSNTPPPSTRAEATGCTLSHAQHAYAVARLDGRAHVLECDYRDLAGRYDKIASVGMFEHVGRRGASQYFRKMADLLAPDGLYLHHAIARPQGVREDAANLFVRRYIFPGGQFIHLHEMIRAAEEAGFEVLDVENLRPHYALTCRLWEQRLAARREAALRLVDERDLPRLAHLAGRLLTEFRRRFQQRLPGPARQTRLPAPPRGGSG